MLIIHALLCLVNIFGYTLCIIVQDDTFTYEDMIYMTYKQKPSRWLVRFCLAHSGQQQTSLENIYQYVFLWLKHMLPVS